MGKVWKKGAAIVLASCMCAGALSGCGKKTDAISAFTFNGKKVDGDFANFVLRFEQSSLDDLYAYYGSMMQQDIWSMDDGQGLGITTWDTFKSTVGEDIEKLLLAEEHASEYDVSLTEEDQKAIEDAAAKFLAENDEKALSSMSANKETVERYLTLSTIKAKVDEAIGSEVDTNVSDEEAAQRTVSYIRYTPSTEAEPESESEENEALTEADVENTAPAGEDAQTMTEGETSVVETQESKKTKASGETQMTEAWQTETDEALTDAEQVLTEAEQGSDSDFEAEDPAMAQAREKYLAMAEETLDAILNGGTDFDEAIEMVNEEGVTGVSSSSYTFGKDDTVPDAEIIEATDDLSDGMLVDHVVEAGGSYYILHVDTAFDEEATSRKKEEIVEQRREEKVNEVYDQWIADEKFEADAKTLAAVLKDRSYSAPVSPETEPAQGTLMTEETELHMEVTLESEMMVETEAEEKTPGTEAEEKAAGAETEKKD